MAGIYNGRSMTTHTLDVLHGYKSDTDAVTWTAAFSSSQLGSVTGNVAYAGRCVHLNSSGDFEFGVTNRSMGMWLLQNSNDPDVTNDGGTASTDADAWHPIRPTDKLTAVVAAGAYELETTEFNTSLTYAPNDTLTAVTGTTLSTCGVMTNASAVPYTNPVCGVASAAKYTNSHGRSALRFWPVYLPVA